MANLQSDVTLQTEGPDGWFFCEGISGIPVPHPCWLVLSGCGNSALQPLVQTLRREVLWELLALAPSMRKVVPIPDCPRRIESPVRNCRLPRYCPQARKLLVLIGDSRWPIAATRLVNEWLSRRPYYKIMPVYPQGQTALPPTLAHLQITSWGSAIAEVVPAILATVEMTSEDFRIFISFKRDESRDLAEQLFEELSKVRFDVFLDRFCIPPAANFQTRIRQELSDKAMVLLLESAGTRRSLWTRFEVHYARKNRLGLLALSLPGALPMPGIRHDMRLQVHRGELSPSLRPLQQPKLDQAISRIQQEHQRAIVRRRYFLRQSMIKALLAAHAGQPSLGTDGVLRTCSATAVSQRKYGIWLTPRPAELSDFQAARLSQSPNETSLVLGPAEALEPARRAALDWLATETRIGFHDEGHMLQVAQEIAGGTI